MKPKSYHYLLIIMLFMCEFIFAQNEKLSDYYLIQRRYENGAENDSTVLPMVSQFIRKAKKDKNLQQLFQGYKDARYFSPDPDVKLKYADSAIFVATELKDDNLLSTAYLSKGAVYYFSFKKYKLAFDEYLRAFNRNKKNKDPYFTNKINYHIGVVKSYIGYYNDALKDFDEARIFFENEIKKDLHPNLMYNNQRGYYNTLHQMAVCHRNLKNFKTADSLVSIGISNTWKISDYKQELSYFLKEQGISKYHRKDFGGSVIALKNSLPELIAKNDFAWITVVYSYLGKANWELGQKDEAIAYFNKVDSIFNKHSFVLPEVRDIYETLITYYGEQDNAKATLYYIQQLLKVDKVLKQDFMYLSARIYRDYDTEKLLKEKHRLERKQSIISWIVVAIIASSIFLGFYFILRFRSRKNGFGNTNFLGINLGRKWYPEMQEGTYRIRNYVKADLNSDLVDTILIKLQEFEQSGEYLQNRLTVVSLAEKFDVSPIYLAEVVHKHKGASFSRYISELRIAYITDKLYTESRYLQYKSITLAQECGIASRANFSNLFREINGITPTEFIKMRLKDVNKNSKA